MAKFIFITGGVVSGLGKGITGSSLGVLLKQSGFKIFMQKFDPYLNIDPGTMNPVEHGEVYVTEDGGETDLDLGHYERFTDVTLNKLSAVSAGKIYLEVLDKERHGKYKGKTVQVIPHITNAIKEKIYEAEKISQADVIICEIGGTVGDIESQPFIEAIRQVKMERGVNNTVFIHVGLIPFLKVTEEHKTKPIQHSVRETLSLGIQPDIIIARTEGKINEELKLKISLFCNIEINNVIICPDTDTIYRVPFILQESNLHKIVANKLNINVEKTDMSNWKELIKDIDESKKELKIHVVGKYIDLKDAYLSVIESLRFSGYKIHKKIKFVWINSRKLTADNIAEQLNDAKGILVPGGFGQDGTEGKILAINYARVNDIPFLGICFGMQFACIEFARNVLNLKDADSTEINPKTLNPIIDIIEGKEREKIGGTLRLGKYTTKLKKGSIAQKLYNNDIAIERHRHRYEFNNDYLKQFEEAGMVFSGIYEEQNLIEIIEFPKNKFFVGCQYHPEFTSRPNKPNPLFKGFVDAVEKYQ